MRVLVTGAAGLVGTRLQPRLREAGHESVGCDLDVDVSDPEAMGEKLAEVRPDAVVHLAAISSTRNPDDDPNEVFRINFGGAAALFDAVARHRPEARVLFVSTGLVYGSLPADRDGFDESAPLRPRGAYAWTKAAGDRLATTRVARGMDIVTVRPFNHTGPGRRADFAESRLAREIAAVELGLQEPVVKAYNLAARRDFLDVDDVIEAYLQLLDPRVAPGVYNLASGRGRSIQEIWDTLMVHSSATVQLISDPADQDASDRSIGDARRLRAATGWEPTRDLDETLGRLLAWWRESLAASQ